MTGPDDTGTPDPDAAVPAHQGDFLAEQRAMARTAAVVDRSHRGVLAVPGDDRLTWLHLLLTQHVSELPDGAGTEALVLDLNGRVLHHAVVAHVGGTVWLDHGGGLLTMYCHLSRVDVKVGDVLKTGERLAAVGATGRVTGPHLHWGVMLNRAMVDPALFIAA